MRTLLAALAGVLCFSAPALAGELRSFWEIEPRAGIMRVCGTCRKGAPWDPAVRGELQVQSIQPLFYAGPVFISGGGYVRLGGFEHSFQGAGGFFGEVRLDRFDIRPSVGVAYSDRRITDEWKGYRRLRGQSRHTFDLALTAGYRITPGLRLLVGYSHNSNGSDISINPFPEAGGNPGLDTVFTGVSLRL